MPYRVKKSILQTYPQLVTQVNGKRVSLTDKKVVGQREGTNGMPPVELVAEPATQEDLRLLHKEGHPFIEEHEPNAKQPVTAG
ncbi:MAG: hypothetical protein E6Q97_33375 [Desulfurellales bacterium]|nr:MAG: hypothetical protein E6Q97_33375 [Desulfurellales bacterium]